MQGKITKRIVSPTLAQVGQLAVDLHCAKRERVVARLALQVRTKECQAQYGVDMPAAQLDALTQSQFAAVREAKSQEYNVVRRLNRACTSYLLEGAGDA